MVSGLYLYCIGVLLQCYINYGQAAVKVSLGIAGIGLSIVLAVWTFVVLRLQTDDGIWTEFAAKVGGKEMIVVKPQSASLNASLDSAIMC